MSGKFHGRGSLVGCSPWGRWGSDTTERLHFYFSLSCIGEGNGNPLQCSCLESPRDRGARWAAVYGVAQNWTQLKWLSSSSKDFHFYLFTVINPNLWFRDLTQKSCQLFPNDIFKNRKIVKCMFMGRFQIGLDKPLHLSFYFLCYLWISFLLVPYSPIIMFCVNQ